MIALPGRKASWLKLLALITRLVGLAVFPLPAATPQVIEKIKAATAYLEIPGEGSGTAFCTSAEGIYFTCAHVLEGKGPGDEVPLVIAAGTAAEKKVSARIARMDTDLDIAVLRADLKTPAFLPMGDSGKMKETDAVIAAGYPFGNALALGGKAPAVSINTGKVTAIRREGDRIAALQVDAEFNPGNSGGPVTDSEGRVVGMATAKITGTVLNFATSTTWLLAVAESPGFRLNSSADDLEKVDSSKPLEIEFTLDFLKPPAKPPEVSVSLSSAGADRQNMNVTPKANGVYSARIASLPASAGKGGKLLRVEAFQQQGNFRFSSSGNVQDREISIGGKKVWLSRCSVLMPVESRAISSDWQETKGAIAGLDQLATYPDGTPLSSVASSPLILIRPAEQTQNSMTLKITVKGDKYTSNWQRPVKLNQESAAGPPFGSPVIPAFSYDKPSDAEFAGELVDLPMGGEITAVKTGGGGRYAIVHLLRQSKIVIVDAWAGKVAGEIPGAGPDAKFAAGGHELFLAKGDQIERWSLADVKQMSPPKKCLIGKVTALGCGSAWTREVIVASSLFEGERGNHIEVRDARSLEILAIEPHQHKVMSDFDSMEVSDLGRTIAFPARHGNENPAYFLTDRGMEARSRIPSSSPDAGGTWLISAQGTYELLSRSGWTGGSDKMGPLIPTTVPGLAARLRASPSQGRRDAVPPVLDLIDLNGGEVILSGALLLDELDGAPWAQQHGGSDGLSPRESCTVVPQFGRVVTIGTKLNSIRIRKLDAWVAMRDAGAPFVFVTSLLPDQVAAGTAFNHTIKVEASKPEGTRFEVLSAPEGLSVSSSGSLSWPDPKAGKGGNLIVRIIAADGAETILSKQIYVR